MSAIATLAPRDNALECFAMPAFAFMLLSLLTCRALLLAHWPSASWTLSAVMADIGLATFLGALLLALMRIHRALAVLLLLAYISFLGANMESVLALNKAIDLRDLVYVTDPAFLSASAYRLQYPGFLLVTFICGLLCLAYPREKTPSPARLLGLVIVAGLVLGLNRAPSWQDNQMMVVGLHRALQVADAPGSGKASTIPGLQRDLSGQSMLGTERARNVVLLVLEGIPGAYVERIRQATGYHSANTMPQLSGLAEQALVAPGMVSHSHQTIRGLYALLCADYSKLALDTTKAQEYLQLDTTARPQCLPSALAEAGFFTQYLQAARLSYMGKDVVMPAIGFQMVKGEESFPRHYVDIGWGPDDRAFLEQAADEIRTAHDADAPFFTTLLTVGTHHPYSVPADVAGSNPREAAIAWLDRAVGEFYRSLEQDGVWRDTLLIITADESHGLADHPLGGNWVPLLALGPGITGQSVAGAYGLIDIPLTVMDYLGLAQSFPGMGGRSIFRSYDAPRELLFSSDYVYAQNQQGQLFYCTASGQCFESPAGTAGLFSHPRQFQPVAPEQAPERAQQLERWRTAADGSLRLRQASDALQLSGGPIAIARGELNVLSAGRYVRLSAGETARVTIEAHYRGSGFARLQQQLIDSESGVNLAPERELPILGDGDRIRIAYLLHAERDIAAAQVLLRASTRQDTGTMTLDSFALEPVTPASAATHTTAFTVRVNAGQRVIGHASGRWRQWNYSNSLQGLRHNRERYPLMELDLALTSDQHLVCLHGWELGYRALFGESIEQPLSLAQFQAKTDDLPFTPCDENSLSRLLDITPGLRIVVDSWSDTRLTARRLLDTMPSARSRIIPQAYSPQDYGELQAMGFDNIILTLYRYEHREDLAHIQALLDELRPFAVAIPSQLTETPSYLKTLVQSGIPVYVHTINRCEQASEIWAAGASIYTDSLVYGDCSDKGL